MRALVRMTLALPLVFALANPAGAQEYVPVFNTERAYVHCGADKVTANEHATYSWNTTAPAASFTTGAGCGSLDSDKIDGDGVTFTGKHTGNLKQLTVHAWVIDCCVVRAGAFAEIYANVSVQIDGTDVVSGVEAHLAPIPSETGISRLLEFSVTGLKLLTEADYREHEVVVNLETASYLDGDQIGWVLDATEVDSGVTFSPTTLAATRVPADG
ncbi:MAG: hypothetical protein ACRDHM_11270 [Actinomycetota bacterium]